MSTQKLHTAGHGSVIHNSRRVEPERLPTDERISDMDMRVVESYCTVRGPGRAVTQADSAEGAGCEGPRGPCVCL